MTVESPTPQGTTEVPQPHFVAGEPFYALKKVETYTATAKKDSQEYIKINVKRKLPRITDLKGFMEVKGHDKPIVLVGGGPSLKRPEILAELREMAKSCPVLAVGSAHDYLVSQGIIPNGAAAVDPDPIMANYFQNPQSSTVYLIASQCHPSLFDHLRLHKVALWHSYSLEDEPVLNEAEPNNFGVGGGCTIGMRAISMAILFGYSNIHFFGFDSCLDADGTDHAYPLSTPEEMAGLLGQSGKLYPVRLGLNKPESKTYMCMGYQLAQLWHFHDYYKYHYNLFSPTIHGGGPLAELVPIVQAEIEHGLKTGDYVKADMESPVKVIA